MSTSGINTLSYNGEYPNFKILTSVFRVINLFLVVADAARG
jgi:hypothetical protein